MFVVVRGKTKMYLFDDIYVSRIYYLRENNEKPEYSTSRPVAIHLYRYDETVVALMLVIRKKPTRQEVETKSVLSLQKVLQRIPIQFEQGTLSWLRLEEQQDLSALLIHTNISQEQLSSFTELRLTSIVRDKNLKKGLWILLPNIKKQALSDIKEATEQAQKGFLFDSKPVASFIQDRGDVQEIQEEVLPRKRIFLMSKIRSSIVIKRSPEAVFSHFSDITQPLLNTRINRSKARIHWSFGTPNTLNVHLPQFKVIQQTPEEPLQVGTNFLIEAHTSSNVSSKLICQISEYEPPYRISCTFGGKFLPSGETKIILIPVIEGTRVKATVILRDGYYGIAGLFLYLLIKKQTKLDMEQIKEEIESRPVPLL